MDDFHEWCWKRAREIEALIKQTPDKDQRELLQFLAQQYISLATKRQVPASH